MHVSQCYNLLLYLLLNLILYVKAVDLKIRPTIPTSARLVEGAQLGFGDEVPGLLSRSLP